MEGKPDGQRTRPEPALSAPNGSSLARRAVCLTGSSGSRAVVGRRPLLAPSAGAPQRSDASAVRENPTSGGQGQCRRS